MGVQPLGFGAVGDVQHTLAVALHHIGFATAAGHDRGDRPEEKKYSGATAKKKTLKTKLGGPTQRKHDEVVETKLQADLEQIQDDIAQGHRDKLDWSKKLYPIENKVHLERTNVSLLQVRCFPYMRPFLVYHTST